MPRENISEAPRHVRQAAYKKERTERASGKWSPWLKASPEQIERAYAATDAEIGACFGWTREVHTVWTNGWMSVSIRTIRNTSLGFDIDHAFIRTALSAELTWKEKQRIKNEIFGTNRMAVEVFPRTADLTDAADIYHLWVFPPGARFDFGLGPNQR